MAAKEPNYDVSTAQVSRAQELSDKITGTLKGSKSTHVTLTNSELREVAVLLALLAERG